MDAGPGLFRFPRPGFLMIGAVVGTLMSDAAAGTRPPSADTATEPSSELDSVQRPSFVPDYAEVVTAIDTPACKVELEPQFDPGLYETRTVFVWTPNDVLDRWPPFSIRLSEAGLRRLTAESPALAMALLALDTASEDRIHAFDVYAGFRLALPLDLSEQDVEVRNESGMTHWYRTRNVLERTSEPERAITASITPDPPMGSTPPSWLSIRIDHPPHARFGRARTETFVVRLHEEPARRLAVAGSNGWMAGEFEIHTIYTARGPIRLTSR